MCNYRFFFTEKSLMPHASRLDHVTRLCKFFSFVTFFVVISLSSTHELRKKKLRSFTSIVGGTTLDDFINLLICIQNVSTELKIKYITSLVPKVRFWIRCKLIKRHRTYHSDNSIYIPALIFFS